MNTDIHLSWDSSQIDFNEINIHGNVDNQQQDIEYFRELYRLAIEYLDQKITGYISKIKENTELETTIIITSDHGENLCENINRLGHSSSLSESLLHVPLHIINPPKSIDFNSEKFFSLVNLDQLVNSLITEESEDIFSDRISAERIGSYNSTIPDTHSEDWNRMIRCVYQNDTKWVWDSTGATKKYKLDRDTYSNQVLVSTNAVIPQWARDEFDTPINEYKKTAENNESVMNIDSASKDHLKNLGYL
jgi:hypothetical protein